MAQGRPVPSFAQVDPDLPAEVPIDPPPVQASPPDRLANALRFSSNYVSIPELEGQAKAYPDSVKVVDTRYRTFDTSKPTDMDEYSEIWISHKAGGQYIFDSDEKLEWDAANSRWLLLVRVSTRMFKTTQTSRTNPDNL
jgi:hypothetical protein